MNSAISEHSLPPDSPNGRPLALAGAALLFAPVVGVPITALWMAREFTEISRSMPSSDPSSASGAIGHVLIPAVVSYGISTIGVTLLLVAMRRSTFTPRWVWRALLGASLLWLLAFPIGTVIALVGQIFLYRTRHVFTTPPNA